MAKRFTESGKWKKKWIRQLDPKYKLFWFYLLDNCDHAGVFDADIESASFHIGLEYTEKEVLEVFNRKIVPFKTDKWFIPKFVEYQYGELNENNRAHLSVINILNKYNLLDPNKTLARPLKGVKEQVKVQVKVKDKSKGKSSQLESIKNNLEELQSEFPTVNVKIEYDKFVDYLAANGKTYKNYNAGFKNWLRNDSFGKATIEPKKVLRSVDVICTECDHSFKQKSGMINNSRCPKCNEFGVVDAITYNLIKRPSNGS
jgi:rubrerythrin